MNEQGSWRLAETPEDWKKANVTGIINKDKEDPGNHRAVSLMSVLGKVVEQTILETISKHMKDSKMVGSSQHGFMKEKSCLSNLMVFYSEMIGSVDARRAVYVVYLVFKTYSKDGVSYNILTDKLKKYRLDEYTVRLKTN
ncbi:rna-directed dna polymerase from mobile element jockey- hypothetical protein [Limosa lapponica baueri]|uniref:Rna-directed dna polymerase from mobile element jockey-like n=1 Tax=Limosa lapponica baueri TaxID=1758121 RepID=A0A2I0U1Q8_LIMLA|nr:rna-directed dna polymerase from mobile element jockey- hypothetical protein [Limosa lapponica baueri]